MQICLFLFGNTEKLQKKVFIIIVSYNGAKWIQKNLESIEKSSYDVNIIVVDNNSTDDTVSIVKQFPDVDLIQSEINLGFGKANNLGINKAISKGADYLFLLNQDTWIFPDAIGNLVEVAERNPGYGIISPVHLSGDGVHLDENFSTYWKRKIQSISENVDELPFVNAAAWLIPKKVIEKVGHFEPMFNHYGEDRNFADRINYHNYKIVLAKNSKICHDRVITRHFNKDVIQSKFIILSAVLNINDALVVSYLKGFRFVVGLPKYFHKFYSIKRMMKLFCKLLIFYLSLKLSIFKIYKIRESYK